MTPEAVKCFEEWEPVNKRIIRATFNSQYMKVTIVQCYAPTNEAEKEDKEEFYEQLQAVKEKIPKHHIIIIMGDFNAKVGSDNADFERTMDRHGVGDCNENGQKLLEFCSVIELVITGMLFEHKDIHKSTWGLPDHATNNQIDHIMVNGKYRRSVLDTKARCGVNTGSDHHVVICKLKLKLKRTDRKTKTKQKRYDVRTFKDPACRERFRIELRNRFAVLEGDDEEKRCRDNLGGNQNNIRRNSRRNNWEEKKRRRI